MDKSAAYKRVTDALEAGREPVLDDIRAAGLCPVCIGFGYIDTGEDDEDGIAIQPICKHCNGSGQINTQA